MDETGCFTAAAEEAAPFAGLPVLSEGNRAVLDALEARGFLVHVSKYLHRYPYDWRSKTPVIFRTTPQWCDLAQTRRPKLAPNSPKLAPISPQTRPTAPEVRGPRSHRDLA